MKKKRQTALAILILLLIALLAAGCKPQQLITEKVVTVEDSTTIARLTEEVAKRDKTIEVLTSDLERTREENILLRSESSSHQIDYDTDGQINPETGEYPKKGETITHSKYEYDRVITENETLKKEHRREVEMLENKITNLNVTVESLKQENSQLQNKQAVKFHFKSFLYGIIAGATLLLLLVLFLKR